MDASITPDIGVDSPRAWLVVVGGFFSTCVAFGVSYAFGVFLRPLQATFHVSHATLATLFSAVTVLSYFLGPITGRLADRIGPRPVVAAGAVLMGGGLLLSARTSGSRCSISPSEFVSGRQWPAAMFHPSRRLASGSRSSATWHSASPSREQAWAR